MNEFFIKQAIIEAKKAYKKGEVPVGAVLVKNNEILVKSHNTVEKDKIVTKHAEIKVIEKASKKIDNWRLNECDLYVTLEPCTMCMGAIESSRIRHVYYILSKKNIEEGKKTSFKKMSFYEKEYLKILQDFFKEKRK